MAVKIGPKKIGTAPKSAESEFQKYLVSKPVIAHTTKQVKGLPEESKEEVVAPGLVIPADQLHTLRVEGSSTINLGNYNSAKISVGVTAPCTKETLEETYMWATEWISGKIQEATEETKKLTEG